MYRHLPEIQPHPTLSMPGRPFFSPNRRFDYKESLPILKRFGYDVLDVPKELVIISPRGSERVKIVTSAEIPNAVIVTTQKAREVSEHATVVIKRGDKYEFYDPEGRPPPETLKHVFPGLIYDAAPVRHQYDALSCSRHALTRACLNHMDQASYNATISAAMTKYGMTADNVVRGITNRTLEVAPITVAAPQQVLKAGGIVYGRKYK